MIEQMHWITRNPVLWSGALALLLQVPITPAQAAPEGKTQFGLPSLARADFNRMAVLTDSPLHWVEDKNGDGLLDPGELAARGEGRPLAPFVQNGRFTPRMTREYQILVEARRREAVARELNGGRPTMVHTDLSSATEQDRKVVKALLAAAAVIEDLYHHQTGAFALERALAKASPQDRALFFRNHGPWCQAPESAGDGLCNALPDFPPKRSEAYPKDGLQDEAMCKTLASQPNAKDLLDPFTVVEKRGDGYQSKPLTAVYGKDMKTVAGHLRAAARVLEKDPKEQAFTRYLLAAAQGFETNKWEEADEAWAAMNSLNSRFYLRVGPDEVYFDPCQQKAGFHLALAFIDATSLTWQQRLTPLRKEMEEAIARLIGSPYKARDVQFHMPDFINVVWNAGDSRHPVGAVIGQSLPNWGKVANEGRGRTVVMANLYTDADSRRDGRLKAETMFSTETLKFYTGEQGPFLLNVILHEASHNFGPHSDFHIDGKAAKEVFGGKLASTLEELKAQTAGLWYLSFLKKKGLVDDTMLRQAYTEAISWAFGHISRGMFTPDGNVQPYSQLAAIQVGFFRKEGALSFKDGKFTIHFDKMPTAIEKLMQRVGQLKARGDKAGAEKLVEQYVTGADHKLCEEPLIKERLLRFPKAAFYYSVTY